MFLFAFLRDLFIFPRWCWHLYYPKNPNCDEYDSGSQWGSILSRYFLPRFTIVRDYSPWIPAFCNPLCHWDFLSLSPVLSLWSPNEGSWPIVLGWVSMTNLLSSPHSPPISHTSLSHNNAAAADGSQLSSSRAKYGEILATLFTINACICALHCIDTILHCNSLNIKVYFLFSSGMQKIWNDTQKSYILLYLWLELVQLLSLKFVKFSVISSSWWGKPRPSPDQGPGDLETRDHPGGEADQLSPGRAHTKIVSINWAIKEWKMLLLRHNGWQHCGPGPDPGGVWWPPVQLRGLRLITDTQLFRSDQGRTSGQ